MDNSLLENKEINISGVDGDIIGVGIDGNGNIIGKTINIVVEEVKKDYGLNLLPRNYFKKHMGTENDFKNWKNGFSFGLESIYEKKELRRSVVDVIKNNLEKNHRLLLLGESGSSKSTILMEIMCEYFDNGYQILYNFGNTDLRNDESLIDFIENMANANNNVLIAVDNVHDKKTSAIFYLMEKLESYERKENFLFVLAARIPEYSLLVKDRLVEIQEEKHRDSIRKFRGDRTLEFRIPPFTIEEVKEFIIKYADIRPIKEREEQDIQSILNKKSSDIYNNTKGNPIMVKFAVFGEGLRNDVENRYIKYMHDPINKLPDPFKIQTAIVCSLLDIAGIQINDKLLESMKLKQYARGLRHALFYNYPDGTWKTIHPRWDIELLSFLYGEKLDEDELEERKYYLLDSLKTIFIMRDEKISSSVIQILYDSTAVIANDFEKIPIDLVDSVVQMPDYINEHTKCLLYSSTIAFNYFKLRRYNEALEKCQKAIELDSRYANAWYNRGVILYNLARYEEAIVSLSKAIELDPNDAYSRYSIGNIYGFQHNHYQAIECYNKAIELDPKLIDAWRNKGISFFELGYLPNSIECYNKAIELRPTDGSIWYIKSIALTQMGKDKEAIECYNKAIELDSKLSL